MAKGDEILSRAKAHWDSIRGQLESVDVPEWQSVIYYRAANLAEMDQIQQKMDKGLVHGAVEMLIVRGRDEEGAPLFKPVHRTELLRMVSADVALRIVNAMHQDAPTLGEAEGN